MLREIAATFRTFALGRATPPVAVAFAMLVGGALVAGCGIKGPLKLPPRAATTAPAAPDSAKKPAAPGAPAAAADADAPATPKP